MADPASEPRSQIKQSAKISILALCFIYYRSTNYAARRNRRWLLPMRTVWVLPAVRVSAVVRVRAVRPVRLLAVRALLRLLVLRPLVAACVHLEAARVVRLLAERVPELLRAVLLLLLRVLLDEAERPVLRVAEVVKNFWPTFTNRCWLPWAFCSCFGVMLPLAMAQSIICWNKLV